jgi:hypothetical protein
MQLAKDRKGIEDDWEGYRVWAKNRLDVENDRRGTEPALRWHRERSVSIGSHAAESFN